MIEKLPKKMQESARRFRDRNEFRGPKNKVDAETSDRVLLSTELNITNESQKDNTSVDTDPRPGVVRTHNSHLEFESTERGLEFYSESVGDAPFQLVSQGVSGVKGVDYVLGMVDRSGNVLNEGAVHLDRLYGDESFFAGDLKGLPGA
jgi:hypothetical protein